MRRTLTLLALAALTLTILAPAAVAAVFTGTSGPDRLVGTNQADSIEARGSRDLAIGRGGSDTITGGRGNDSSAYGSQGLFGDAPSIKANSKLDGGDLVLGGPGSDDLVGHGGSDRLYGGSGDDMILAEEYRFAHDGTYRQIPSKNPGRDMVRAGGGADQVYSLDGRSDWIDCGDGKDDVAVFDRGLDRVAKTCENRHPRTF